MLNIEDFIENNKEIILEEHAEELRRYHQFLEPYTLQEQVISKHGIHFINCPWANSYAIEGPDTCPCALVLKYKLEMTKIVNLFLRISNK